MTGPVYFIIGVWGAVGLLLAFALGVWIAKQFFD